MGHECREFKKTIIFAKKQDLTYEFIKDLLTARQEVKVGKLERYSFDEK